MQAGDDGMTLAEELTKKASSIYRAAILDRAKVLFDSGYTVDEIDQRWEGNGVTILFARNVADSKFWIETEGTTLTIRGESMR
jgi:hypothetical protein